MYWEKAMMRHTGPINSLYHQMKFNEDCTPQPLVVVGTNGSGNTHFLSSIADALCFGAASHYQNILPSSPNVQSNVRTSFRRAGGYSVTDGKAWSVVKLNFIHHNYPYQYSPH